ncbi:MAG TPA: tetratricopeptide repeat protein [Candidatus Glassbacteria bacterium]|nr:tetratricopeptide repeat protein [Candidatus Glassbacteria bacterium]
MDTLGINFSISGNCGSILHNIGRNDPCPCGSGKKYKRCCLPRKSIPLRADSASGISETIDIPRAIQAGMAHHRAGRLQDAAVIYRKVLTRDPRNPDALHLLGVIAHQVGNPQQAVECISLAIDYCDQAVPRIPSNPIAHNNLGEAYRALGRIAEAVACYEQALLLRPDYAEAHYHLGLALEDQGKAEEAVVRYRKALSAKPELVLAHYNLGTALKAQGKLDEAALCFQQVLRLEPDNDPAQFLLSSLTGQNPERPPGRYIAHLFDNHAPNFDEHLVRELQYTVPEDLVFLARQRANNPEEKWNVLDLGCGTGLLGLAVASYARQLVGVDLSARMLAKARDRNLYHRLEQLDVLSMMKLEAASSYDLIVAADVFVYLGNLDDTIREATRLLRPNGLVAFSVEALERLASEDARQDTPKDYQLSQTGRYVQSSDYLRKLAVENGFKTIDISPTQIRLEKGRPVHGWLAILGN